MKLDTHLKLTNQTYRQFAERLGEDASQVHRWATGKRYPSLLIAARICELTNGDVTPMDFLAPAETTVAAE